MPTTYSHYRFGSECLRSLPVAVRETLQPHRMLFDLGVQGPDIFFYYHPLKSNPVRDYGYAMHTHSAERFFQNALCHIQSLREEERAQAWAYLLGFLSHFVLDASCHGFIGRFEARSGVSHNRIEADYDRLLMARDGMEHPSSFQRSTLVPLDAASFEVISGFFPFTAEEIAGAIRSQRRILNLFTSSGTLKKKAVTAIIRGLKLSGHLDDLFVDKEPDPQCRESREHLDQCFAEARLRYPQLARSLNERMEHHTPLDPLFRSNFEEGFETIAMNE